jgi:hypothetical protein
MRTYAETARPERTGNRPTSKMAHSWYYASRVIGNLVLDALLSRSELVIVAELLDHVRLSGM